jgi:hypothetical protein
MDLDDEWDSFMIDDSSFKTKPHFEKKRDTTYYGRPLRQPGRAVTPPPDLQPAGPDKQAENVDPSDPASTYVSVGDTRNGKCSPYLHTLHESFTS